MKPIHLIPMGAAPAAPNGAGATWLSTRAASGNGDVPGLNMLESLAATLARIFRTPCRIQPTALDISFAWDEKRGQYHSTAILQRLEREGGSHAVQLGVTACDLYVPVLTFVFGEAQLDGNCAVVSTARLGDEFYGLPPSGEMLKTRLVKEAVHEIGHTFGLRHCDDWRCVMTSSHAVERLDVKGADFCKSCRKPVFTNGYW